MTQAVSSKELNGILSVGQMVLYFPEPSKDHRDSRKAHVQGWRQGQYISLELVFDAHRSAVLKQGAVSSVRFVHDGRIHAFTSTTLDSRADYRDPTFRVAWPDSVNVLQLRKHQRVSVGIKCTLTLGDARCDGVIEDLSAGGLKAWMPVSTEAGQRLRCTFTLPDGALIEDAACEVKNAEKSREGYIAGCAFDGLCAKAREEIDFFIAMTMAAARAEEPPAKLLVIGSEFGALQPFLDRLRQENFIVSTASGAIEGFAKLRSMRPSLVMFGTIQRDLDAATMRDVMRGTSPFSETPVVWYGEGAPAGSGSSRPELEGHWAGLSNPEEGLAEVRRLLKR